MTTSSIVKKFLLTIANPGLTHVDRGRDTSVGCPRNIVLYRRLGPWVTYYRNLKMKYVDGNISYKPGSGIYYKIICLILISTIQNDGIASISLIVTL